MVLKQKGRGLWNFGAVAVLLWGGVISAQTDGLQESVYRLGTLKPQDSVSTLKVGDKAPDFSLPSVGGLKISLSQYLEKKNVVISFVPAAWTPVCSKQWPEYNNAKDMFDKKDAMLLGISVDNTPTLYSWTKNMCGVDETIWFPVLSDFYPHGAVAKKYGVLRSDGLSERALFVVDKQGIIRWTDIHDINEKPSLKDLTNALEKLN